MPYVPSLPGNARFPHVLLRFQRGAKPLLELHEAILRADGPLSVGDREMIAAYVSGLNACVYGVGAHAAVARLMGMPEGLIDDLVTDLDRADVHAKIKPLLAFVRKLTLAPGKLSQEDADAVFEAGWEEEALYLAVQICCLRSYMDRLVEGVGLIPDPAEHDMEAETLLRGYVTLAERF